jgi:tetratricopeptide (TPR) repeat protein
LFESLSQTAPRFLTAFVPQEGFRKVAGKGTSGNMNNLAQIMPGMRQRAWQPLLCCLLFLIACSVYAADFQAEVVRASEALQPIQEQLGQQVEEGQLAQANQQLLNFFPKADRTAAEAFVLGNMLYSMDAKLSYELHKETAQQLPHEPLVLMEWAMEEHRAGHYAGALAAYDECSKANPQYAPFHGLAADCLIRLGKTREAVARWQESEKAQDGTLDTLESLVCDIYRDPTLEQRRADLRSKAQQGDIDAAVNLIALDGKYERDWWNNYPNVSHLTHDLPVLQKLPPGPRVKAALCVGECLMKQEAKAKDITAILIQYGYLIDPGKTLPSDGAMISLMLGTAIDENVMTIQEARHQFGETLRATTKSSKDSSLLNVVAYLYVDTEEEAGIERQA